MSKLKSEKLELAEKVLKAVENRISTNVAEIHWTEMYSNGREQGYHIAGGDKVVSFSEDRHSDNIVVYFGNKYTFSMQGNVPSEEVYRNKTFFQNSDVKGASKFIAGVLKDNLIRYNAAVLKSHGK